MGGLSCGWLGALGTFLFLNLIRIHRSCCLDQALLLLGEMARERSCSCYMRWTWNI